MTPTINDKRLAKVLAKPLAHGAHSDHKAMCIMEAVAYVAGEPWSDAPELIEMLRAFVEPFATVSDAALARYPDTPQPTMILAARKLITKATKP